MTQQMPALRILSVKLILLVLIFFEILVGRRDEQLIHPQVWDEEGSVILPALTTQGPQSIFAPINGYLIILPRLISLMSLSVSFKYYPLISTILAWLFIIGVMVAVSISPTILRGGVLLGVAVMLVPSDAEVFGVPLYVFWWASLLIIIAALWRADSAGLWPRLAFVIIGGLSSPAIFLALPIFLLRLLLRRHLQEVFVTAAALLCGALQFSAIAHYSPPTTPLIVSLQHASAIVPRFLGTYLFYNLMPYNTIIFTSAGIVTLIVVFAAIWLDSQSHALYVLCYLWVASVALVAARVDLAILIPVLAGGRYFFFPYVFESWLLLQIAFKRSSWLRYTAATMLLTATINALPVLNKKHDDLHWRENVAACAEVDGSSKYAIPIQYDGEAKLAWQLQLSGNQCRQLQDRSILR